MFANLKENALALLWSGYLAPGDVLSIEVQCADIKVETGKIWIQGPTHSEVVDAQENICRCSAVRASKVVAMRRAVLSIESGYEGTVTCERSKQSLSLSQAIP